MKQSRNLRRLALIVDDEPDIRELLDMTLARMGIDCHTAANLAEARELLGHYIFDLCLTDMRLPDGDGIELVEHIQRHGPTLPVAVITAHGNMRSAIRAMKAGAFDFVSKPIDLKILRDLVNTALALERVPHAAQPGESAASTAPAPVGDDGGLIGSSAPMAVLRRTIDKLARSQAPVWITGESGTGKELVARLIHHKGPRAAAPFVPVNCGAIPTELMESEFFGHKKGSFTGALSDKPGLFRAANGGTLFLDEVAELPLHMQVKLLRAIQERAVRPVGELAEQPVNLRILSASHKNLANEVAAGRFRQDLYYRLNVIEVRVPPLRERDEDVIELAAAMLARLTTDYHADSRPQLAASALDALRRHTFPGNVRELENTLERALALCEGGNIEAADLSLSAATAAPAESAPGDATWPTPNAPASPPVADLPLIEQEREALRRALEATRWNKTAAAEKLGLTYRQLRYKVKKLGLE